MTWRVYSNIMSGYYPTRKKYPPTKFNVISVKLYYKFMGLTECNKTLAPHADISYCSRNPTQPHPSNSQVPGSVVLINTYGQNKLLKFELYRHQRNQVENDNPCLNNSCIEFDLKHKSIFALHPDDEIPNPVKEDTVLPKGYESECLHFILKNNTYDGNTLQN